MRIIALSLMAAVLVALLVRVLHSPAEPTAAFAPPTVGEAAPAFELESHDGRNIEVGGPSPRWTILTFYRSAGTPW